MLPTLPAWLVIAFVVCVALTTLVSALRVLRGCLRFIGLGIGASMFGAMERLRPPPGHPAAAQLDGCVSSRAAIEAGPVLTAEQHLRIRAERIAAVTGNDAEVVLAALREGGSFPDDVERPTAAATA